MVECDGAGIVDIALAILGLSSDDDEDALDVLLGSILVKGLREQAAGGVERIRRFQAGQEARLDRRRIASDAAQRAVEHEPFRGTGRKGQP